MQQHCLSLCVLLLATMLTSQPRAAIAQTTAPPDQQQAQPAGDQPRTLFAQALQTIMQQVLQMLGVIHSLDPPSSGLPIMLPDITTTTTTTTTINDINNGASDNGTPTSNGGSSTAAEGEQTSNELTAEKICGLPKAKGKCRGFMPRFRYDPEKEECSTFIFGGCGGNQNNFRTEEECLTTCGP